ncbi:MAG: RlmI/RlmK family 23S rRNA methyltransferase, partial [Pseudomonadota bacterium]
MIQDPLQRPVVKLRGGKTRRLLMGAPWAYADEIAMDRRTKGLAAGSLVRLVAEGQDLGLAAFNPDSQISARVLGCPAEAVVDADWFAARLRHAMALREALYDTPFYRLVHAEGDGLPGLVIDRFGEALVLQPNAAWVEHRLDALIDAAAKVTGCITLHINASSRIRGLEGLE